MTTLPALKLKRHSTSSNQRRQVIRDNILSVSYEQIAQLCGVSKRTIIRDVNQWRLEGGFEQCLLDEFCRSYPTIKQAYPEHAFDRLCYLLGKTITQRLEATSTHTERLEERRIIIQMWKPIPDEPTANNPP